MAPVFINDIDFKKPPLETLDDVLNKLICYYEQSMMSSDTIHSLQNDLNFFNLKFNKNLKVHIKDHSIIFEGCEGMFVPMPLTRKVLFEKRK